MHVSYKYYSCSYVLSSLCYSAWDDPSIDHWKIEEFKPEHNPHSLVEESSFATLFPRYREKYLQKIWPHVEKKAKEMVSTEIIAACVRYLAETHVRLNRVRCVKHRNNSVELLTNVTIN